jgi:hypothetical protein
MNKKKLRYSKTLECAHCRNRSTMPIVATCDDIEDISDGDEFGCTWSVGQVWEVLRCPAC